jgi:hypothetical protein
LKDSPTGEAGINELVYSLILCMSEDERRGLPEYLRKKINTEKKAASFAYKSSTDQKRDFLSHLGVGFFWTFAAVNKLTTPEYLAVLKEFKKDSLNSSIKEMINKGVYITSDKNHVWLLSRMSQSTQTGTYAKNLELHTIGKYVRKWSIKLKSKEQSETDEMIESVGVVNKLILSTINQYRYTENLNITKEELKMLLYLDANKFSYISHSKLASVFLGSISGKKLSISEKDLLKKMMIQKHVDWRKNEFTITKLGIRTIHQFRDRVLQSFNF